MRTLIVLFLLAVLGGTARAEIVHYLGPHPIAPTVMRGMCHIEGPHFHDYVPHKTVLYVRAGDDWAFVGDPTEFEAEVPRYAYYGHHPVFWAGVEAGPPRPHVCYISGPHHHWYAPPPEYRFVAKGGAYWYVGAMPPGYVRRWHRHSPVDDYYATVSWSVPRPVVTIAPPEGYIGFYIGPGRRRVYYGGPGVYGEVAGPSVQIGIPAPPSINIRLGGGGPVYVDGPPPVYVGGRVKYKGGPPPHAPAHGVRGHGGGHGGGHGKGKWK